MATARLDCDHSPRRQLVEPGQVVEGGKTAGDRCTAVGLRLKGLERGPVLGNQPPGDTVNLLPPHITHWRLRTALQVEDIRPLQLALPGAEHDLEHCDGWRHRNRGRGCRSRSRLRGGGRPTTAPKATA